MAATIVLRPPTASVEPGGEATIEVTVRNAGEVVDEFRIEVLGDAAPWTKAEPDMLRLFPATEGTAQIRFKPPRQATVRAGPTPFGIKAVPKEDPEGTAVEEGTVEVGAFADATLEVIPRTSRGRASGKHELYVDNRGNSRFNAPLVGEDPDDNLDVRLSPPTAVAEPGTATRVKVRARPRKRFFRGQPKTHPYQVRAEPRDREPITSDATMLQEPLIPRWLLPALLLLAALAALWYFALRPTVESAARDAVQEDLGEVEKRVAAVEEATGAGDGPTGQPPGEEPPAEDEPPPRGDGGRRQTPIDLRLQAGAVESYAVPNRRTLSITDLVLQNPAGDFGTLTILRDETPAPGDEGTLLVVRLQNFRDLDYHYVTPIVLTARQVLVLDVTCGNANQNPPINRPCSAALQFSGVLTRSS